MRQSDFEKRIGRELQSGLAGDMPQAWPAIADEVRRNATSAGKSAPDRGKRKWKWKIAVAAAVAVCVVCVPLLLNAIPTVQANAKSVYDDGGKLSGISAGKCSENFIESYNAFGLDLLKRLDSSGKENVFLSPASIYLALGMTYGGASGKTAESFAKTLRLSGGGFDRFGKDCLGLQAMMAGGSFRLANSIWISSDFRDRISSSFLERDRTYFGASIGTLNFNSSAAPKIIGDWIKKNTNGRIDPKLEKFKPQTVMFLANTIYFKSDWKSPFDSSDTGNDVFHTPDGEKTLKFMNAMRRNYFETDTLQGIRLPYADGKTSLLILLPKKDLSGMMDSLTAETLASCLRQSRESEKTAELSLPRVHFRYDASLNDALKAMGLAEAFAPTSPGFGNMVNDAGDDSLYLSQVKHMTALAIDEKGTEAAAATTVAIDASGAMPQNIMKVDHPFFAAIMNDESGAALFAGVVTNPSVGG